MGQYKKGIMTRNYNNQRRDGSRPSSRSYSTNRPGEGRSQYTPRADRPRPNRERLDQAWESGAAPKHADYRSRTPQRQSSQQNWRNSQSSERSSNHNNSRPFGNRQDNAQRFNRSSRSNTGNYGPHSRPSDPERRTHDDRRDGGQRGYAGSPHKKGTHANLRDNRDNEQRSDRSNTGNYGSHSPSSDPQRRTHDDQRNGGQRGYAGSPHKKGTHANFRDNRDNEQRSEYRDRSPKRDSSQRGSERFDRQSREFQRGERFSRNDKQNRRSSQPDTRNPRWQSQQAAHRHNSFRRRSPNADERTPYEEAQFEGDYERFNDSDTQPEERHVTHLPDGRVLKGPRPVQRRNARFWTDITDETQTLLQPVETKRVNTHKQAQTGASAKTGTPKSSPKSRTHKASAVTREKKSRGKQAVTKPRSTGPKPSQRGFQWPTS